MHGLVCRSSRGAGRGRGRGHESSKPTAVHHSEGKPSKKTNKTKGENRSQSFKCISYNHPSPYPNNHSNTKDIYTSIQIQHNHLDFIFIFTSLHSPAIWGHSDTSQIISCTNHRSKHRLLIIAATLAQPIPESKKNPHLGE